MHGEDRLSYAGSFGNISTQGFHSSPITRSISPSSGYSSIPCPTITRSISPLFRLITRSIPPHQGIIPESLKNWKNYKKKEDAKGWTDGIVVPLLPFGLKEFDEGERFDLRSPYADEGWVSVQAGSRHTFKLEMYSYGYVLMMVQVDPEETDMWAGLKKISTKVRTIVCCLPISCVRVGFLIFMPPQILNFSGNNDEYREQYGKPILWAKDYEKYKQDKEAAKNAPPPKGKNRK